MRNRSESVVAGGDPGEDSAARPRLLMLAAAGAPAEALRARVDKAMRRCPVQRLAALPQEAPAVIARHAPSLIIFDLEGFHLDPLALTKEIHAVSAAPLLVAMPRSDSLLAGRLLRLGASGCILHEDFVENFRHAFRHMLGGARFVSETIMQSILHNMAEPSVNDTPADMEALSDRELTVFTHIGRGYAVADIARELHVTTKTVGTHQENIRRKLSLRSKAALRAAAERWLTAQVNTL